MKFLIRLSLALICGNASAATFCVSTSEQLQNALATAQGNGQSDDVRVRTGTFVAPGGGFFYEALASDANDSLTLSGGWTGANTACTGRNRTPGATVLSGAGLRRVMTLNNVETGVANSILVDTLTFKDGSAAAISGNDANRASLSIAQNSALGAVRVENCVFRDNVANNGLAGPSIEGFGTIVFRNNLVADNQVIKGSHSAVVVYASGTAYVQNNTFVHNGSIGLLVTTGMHISSFNGGNGFFENNVVWGSYGGPNLSGASVGLVFDEYNGDGNAFTLRNNNVDQVFQLPANSTGLTSVNPLFADSSNYALSDASPMIGAGVNDAHALGGLGTLDVEGGQRLVGTQVDLGANESSVATPVVLLFANGME